MRRPSFTSLLSALLLLPLSAVAQGNDRALAETLFTDAKRLMAEGKFDEACPKFDDSYSAFPGTGTKINAAACYEKAGKTATAWARYGDASGSARREGNEERVRFVEERRAALEPRLTRIKLDVSADARATPGLEVKVNQRLIPATAFGLGVPVDPGKVLVEASAPERTSFRRELEASEAGLLTVAIDELEATSSSPPPPGSPETPRTSAGSSPTQEQPADGSTQRTLGYVAGGVGVVGLGLGVAFNLMARSAADQADEDCVAGANECTVATSSEGKTRDSNLDSAKSKATISYVALGLGGAALTTGIILIVTAGSSQKTESNARLVPLLSRDQLGLSFSGSL